MLKQFYFDSFSLVCSLDVKTVPFRAIQFSISTLFSSIWPIDRTLSSSAALGQSGPGSDGIEEVLPYSTKLQQYWNLNIRLSSVMTKIFFGGDMQSVNLTLTMYIYV